MPDYAVKVQSRHFDLLDYVLCYIGMPAGGGEYCVAGLTCVVVWLLMPTEALAGVQ
jgi:hypothetical protein